MVEVCYLFFYRVSSELLILILKLENVKCEMCIVYAFLPVVLVKNCFLSLSLLSLSLNHLSFHYSLILIDHAFDLVSLLQLDLMVDLPVVIDCCYCDHHH